MGNILMAASGFNMLTGFEGERPPRFFGLICDRLEPEEEAPPPS